MLRQMSKIATLLVGLGVAQISTASAQQPVAPPAQQPLPPNAAELDALLGAKNYLEIGKVLKAANTANAVLLDMNWESQKMTAGASAFISFAYAFDLWRLGSSLQPPQADELKKTAVMVVLYTYELIDLDGQKCQDVSAPGNRMHQTTMSFPQIIKYGAALPDPDKNIVEQIALKLEQRTAPLRADDDFICRDGLDEIQKGLEKNGDKPLPQLPTQPGMIGKTVGIPQDPTYQAKFVPKDVWLPKQAAERASLPKLLATVLTPPKLAN